MVIWVFDFPREGYKIRKFLARTEWCPIFDNSEVHIYNNFLLEYWFFAKKYNFIFPLLKLNNPYYHNTLLDTFMRSTHYSDPEILRIIEKDLPKRSTKQMSPEVINLLEESIDSSTSESDSDSIVM